MCSSPRHLQRKELQAVENLLCSIPVINSPHRTSKPEDTDSDLMTTEDFREPFGTVSLDLSDEHGNEVHLECSVGHPREITKISWEQLNQSQMASNITLSVDIDCPVQRETYEQLWRLIAYYSNAPAHFKRGTMLSKEPYPTYVYIQDSKRDVLYYTGVKMQVMAQPAWLMQTSANLQLNRLQSSPKMVKLILSTNLSETVEVDVVRRQKKDWVMIQSTNSTNRVLSSILGNKIQMKCNVHSSGQSEIYWIVPNGSKLEAPYSSPDNKVSVSSDGWLVIESVSHLHSGIYYCITKVHGDLAVLPFYLTVQDSSSPSPDENDSIRPITKFAGNPIYLPCIASGSPDAEINWILPSSNIVSFHLNSSRAVVYPNGTLYIPQIQAIDSGFYKCIAINQHGVDTLAAKVNVVRKKGLIRPLRKFTDRPQSASGVNTQIKVPTEDIEEASGDNEVTSEGTRINRLDPLKRRILGAAASGRRGIQPSRSVLWRPAVIRTPTRSHVEDRKVTLKSRSRINMPKNKIDPEKWSDILAKIRERNAPNTVTPVQERRLMEHTTQSQGTTDRSSDSVTVQNEKFQEYSTTNSPIMHTQGIISATVESHTTQAASILQHTTHDRNLDLHTTPSGGFSIQYTTSVPIHAVTFWQAKTSSASSSTFSLEEYHNTDEVKTLDWPTVSERSRKRDKLNVFSILNGDSNLSWSGSQSIPSVSTYESKTSQEGNGKYVTKSQAPFQPKDTTTDDLQSQAKLTTAVPSPITTFVPTTTRRRGSNGKSHSRLRQPVSRRRNGGRRKRPNRRKQQLNATSQNIPTTPANALPATTRIEATTQLKIKPLEVTAKFNTTVPFSSGHAASLEKLSHKESSVFMHSQLATKTSPLPALPSESSLTHLAKPLLPSPSTAPSFRATTPEVIYRNTSSQAALGSSVGPLDVTQRLSITGNSHNTHSVHTSGDLHTATIRQTDVEDNQRTHTENREKNNLDEAGIRVLLPSPSANEYTSSSLITAPNLSLIYTTKSTGFNVEEHIGKTANPTTLPPSVAPGHDSVTQFTEASHFTLHLPPYTRSKINPSVKSPTQEAPRITIYHTQSHIINPVLNILEPTRAPDYDPATKTIDQHLSSPKLQLTSRQTIRQTATSVPTSTMQSHLFRELLTAPTLDVSRMQQLPGQGPIPGGNPRINKRKFQTVTVKAETDAQLPCEVEGQPMPFLSWTKVNNGMYEIHFDVHRTADLNVIMIS